MSHAAPTCLVKIRDSLVSTRPISIRLFFSLRRVIRFKMNSIFSPYNPAKMALSREMSSYGAMADSKVHSDGGIVFYALEIV